MKMLGSYQVLHSFELEPSRDASLRSEEQRTLDDDLHSTIESIARECSFPEASKYLDELAELQKILATLAFRYRVPLSNRLREIVREYDRCDLLEVRKKVFEKIRNGEFPWDPSKA